MNDFLQQFLHDKSATNALLYVCLAFGGQVVHAAKKWADGDVESVAAWLNSKPRRTIGALIANLMAMAAFIGTGAVDALSLGACAALGLFQGYSADSACNKADRHTWTDEERAARRDMP